MYPADNTGRRFCKTSQQVNPQPQTLLQIGKPNTHPPKFEKHLLLPKQQAHVSLNRATLMGASNSNDTSHFLVKALWLHSQSSRQNKLRDLVQ
jgi:hypothetical protein